MTRISHMWLAFPSVVGAFLMIGCGDEMPPPYEGTAQFQLVTPTAVGASCPFPSHSTIFGAVPPTASNPGSVLVDGKDGAKIECSVKGDGTFQFSGSIAYGGALIGFNQGSVPAGGEGTAAGSFFDLPTARALVTTDVPCTIKVNEGSLSVEKGSIWAKFDCQKVTDPQQAGLACATGGFFVFRSCDE